MDDPLRARSGVSIKHFKALESLGWPSGSSYPDDSPEGLDQQP